MRISDWSSDVCSSDLTAGHGRDCSVSAPASAKQLHEIPHRHRIAKPVALREVAAAFAQDVVLAFLFHAFGDDGDAKRVGHGDDRGGEGQRSEEHTSELQSLMRISYAVFCLKKKKIEYNDRK